MYFLNSTNTEIRIVLYISSVHTLGSVNFTHTLLVQTHTHDVYIYMRLFHELSVKFYSLNFEKLKLSFRVS